jgi:hypothetical protein
VCQIKIKLDGRVPLQIEHVAVDFVIGNLLAEMVIISGIPGAEQVGRSIGVPLVAETKALEIV